MLQKWAATAARALRGWYVSKDSDSASAVSGRMGEVGQQSAGHLPLEHHAMANGGFSILPTGSIDPIRPVSSLLSGRSAKSRLCELELYKAAVGDLTQSAISGRREDFPQPAVRCGTDGLRAGVVNPPGLTCAALPLTSEGRQRIKR